MCDKKPDFLRRQTTAICKCLIESLGPLVDFAEVGRRGGMIKH